VGERAPDTERGAQIVERRNVIVVVVREKRRDHVEPVAFARPHERFDRAASVDQERRPVGRGGDEVRARQPVGME
jgi:hypothetical protein